MLARLLMIAAALVSLQGFVSAAAQESKAAAPMSAPAGATVEASVTRRKIVVISDLHFGLGKTAAGTWDPREDFRWTNALRAFLTTTGSAGGDQVDLVIAGDFLELWQPPDEVKCNGSDDAACSVSQMLQIVRRVVSQHADDFKLLADFSIQGDNRIVVIPGNHDAALLVPEIWSEVGAALNVASGRVKLVSEGVWSSADGQVVVEHGHQIGADVNAFAAWPTVLKQNGSMQYLQSPWGERFVQKLFNAEEVTYPIIDNLSPESYGARLRLADRGLWRSVADVARFLAFNLFETTIAQKGQSLGADAKAGQPCSREEAKALGYRLFTLALAEDDPFRREVEASSSEAEALRAELTQLAAALSEDEAAQICRQRKSDGSLGGLLESTFVARQDILRTHARMRLKSFPGMKVFVYAHTHQLERAWDLRLALGSTVTVLNTGAFQRLVDENGYKARLKTLGIQKPSDGLSNIPLKALAACYSYVDIQAGTGAARPDAATKVWRMDETATAGSVVAPGSKDCQ